MGSTTQGASGDENKLIASRLILVAEPMLESVSFTAAQALACSAALAASAISTVLQGLQSRFLHRLVLYPHSSG